MAPNEKELVETNASFYEAFRTRDLKRMDELWAREHAVAVIHPGWPALYGRSAVLESWSDILRGPSPPDISCFQPVPHVMGDVGFVICREKLPDGNLIATNVFAREGGVWKLVHHQAGPTPPLQDEAEREVLH